MITKDLCLRCGKCCRYVTRRGVVTSIKCKYLVEESDGKTSCSIYEKRLGAQTILDNVCMLRSDSRPIIKGCPYNDIIRAKRKS